MTTLQQPSAASLQVALGQIGDSPIEQRLAALERRAFYGELELEPDPRLICSETFVVGRWGNKSVWCARYDDACLIWIGRQYIETNRAAYEEIKGLVFQIDSPTKQSN